MNFTGCNPQKKICCPMIKLNSSNKLVSQKILSFPNDIFLSHEKSINFSEIP